MDLMWVYSVPLCDMYVACVSRRYASSLVDPGLHFHLISCLIFIFFNKYLL